MFVGKKFLLRSFAALSLGFALGGAVFAAAPSEDSAAPTASVKRQSASAQYAKAAEQQAALNAKPSEKRTLADYRQVVMSYRRVALITPRAPEVTDALVAIAELYTEMGDHFGRSYYQSAVDSYEFLVREYPTSKYCQGAMLRIAKLQRDALADSAQAKKTYEDFLKRYPRSPRKREAQEALAELALLQTNDEPAAKDNQAETVATARPVPTTEEPRPNASAHAGGKSIADSGSTEIPRVQRIRATANGDATRVTIDLENSVQYMSGRIAHPDRIFFDLHAARLAPQVAHGNIHVEGSLLTAVRVAQNHAGVVRVVLDVNGVKDYAASLTRNPTQLVIDLYGNSPAKEPVQTAQAKQKQAPTEVDRNDPPVAPKHEARAEQTVVAKNSGADATAQQEQPTNSKNSITGAINGPSITNGAGTATAAGNSSPGVRNSLPSAKNARSKSLKSASGGTQPDLIQPASAPQPTRDGQSTLTRTLGLKVGRIVIDPGHGGHDTGTIGPSGLMEKDLCLDVALRLGKIIEQRLPGADVIYTRSDDTFIPLEERTNIANQAKADLFISIHANSSHDSGARGIETYYLNIKGSAEAMEVAARENATAQEGVHDLQNLVKKIAQTEKIDESKEFAEDIQDSLAKRVQKSGKSLRNRGVRKAPFVVLIGADMPSILTEISFLSNPADEKLLKQPEQRQKVAEGLYQGIASYLQSMNSVTVNLPAKHGAGRPQPSTTAAVEQSRNQR
jgi:N-acetylmuramoyl-L-alanine amidase